MTSTEPSLAGSNGDAGSELVAAPGGEIRTYYDRPILKEPVWKWLIPAYFFSGGLAGASSMLALGGAVTGRRMLARRARVTAVASVAAGTGFLVADLGRPARFYNMLRVAKVTSPMSVGSWLLAGYAPAAGIAAATDLLGVLSGVGVAADVIAGLLGAGLSTYTGVLVADTAVPVWHEARSELPFLFAAGAAAAAGATVAALTPDRDAVPACRLAAIGAVAEIAAAEIMTRRLGDLGEPYRSGPAGRLSTAAKVFSGAGAALIAFGGRRRQVRVASGALIGSGAALTRFAVWQAGRESARDPKYIVEPQRRRLTQRATGDIS